VLLAPPWPSGMMESMASSGQTQIKALAFDFDGTIANSFHVFVHGVESALKRKPFTPEEVEELRQYSARDVVRVLKIRWWRLPFLLAKGTREIDRHQDNITIFPAMTEVLTALHRQGYKLYIVSSHSKKGIELFLERYGLASTFDHIYGKAGLFGKPRALKRLRTQFNYLASDCVFVGDEIRDIEAAKKAGMRCVSVSWGFNTAASLTANSPNAIIAKPTELPALLKKL